MKLAVQLYSLRQYLTSKDQLIHMAKQLEDMGIHYVQLSGFGKLTEEKAAWYETVFRDHDIQVIATHVDYNQLKQEFDFLVDFHQRLNIPNIGIGAMPGQFQRDKVNDYQTFIFEMNHLASKLHEHGLTLTYHHHSFEFVRYGPFLPFDILLQNMNTDQIKLLPDLYWLQVAGVNPLTFIEQYHCFFDLVHIKDMRLERVNDWETTPRFAPVGDGNMSYAPLLNALDEKGIAYAIIEQDDFYGKDPFNEIRRSVDYTRKVLNTHTEAV